jgi:hypothetical protein
MIKTPLFPIEDFSGGLNTATGSKGIGVNQSPNCLNVHSNLYKTLETRKGCSKVNSSATTELTGNGVFVYPYWLNSVLHEQLVCFWDAKMYVMNNIDGTFTEVTLGSAQSNDTFMATVYSTASTNYFIFTNLKMNTPQVYSAGTTTTSLNTATMESCKYLIAWKRHLFCAYTKESGTEYPYRLRRTNISTYGSAATDWTAGVSGYDDVITADGDYITGLRGLRNYLYVFKRNSIFRVAYLGGVPLIELKQMSSVGTDAPQTIRNITLLNGDEIIIFLGTDNKIYMFDGYNNPQSISELINDDNNISAYSLPKMNRNMRPYACACDYSRRHWYVIAFPIGSSSNNCGYIIDYYTQPFSVWPIKGWNAASFVAAEDGFGVKNLYYQAYDGTLYQADVGTSDQLNDIEAFWESPKYKTDKFPLLKKAQQAQLINEAVGNYTYNFRYRTDDNISWNTATINQKGIAGGRLGTFILGTDLLGCTEDAATVMDIPQLFNFIQVKVDDTSSNPRMNLARIDLLGVSPGYAGQVPKATT